jgi:hypothetical protein
MHTLNHGFVMHVLHLQLYGHNERLIHDVNIPYSVKSHNERFFYDANIALLSFLPQIVIENVHTYVLVSYWMQIIPLQWQMLQKVNCNNVLGKFLQKIHGDKC